MNEPPACRPRSRFIGAAEPPATIGDVVFLGSMLPHSLLSKGEGPAQYLVMQGE